MSDIRKLIKSIGGQQTTLSNTQFISPCLPHGKIQTRISGLVYTFTLKDPHYEGWGIFQPQTETTAQKVDDPSLSAIEKYLSQFKCLRVRLISPIQGQTWLAYPINEGAMRDRIGSVKPIAIHLVDEGIQFGSAIGRWDGRSLWFDSTDFSADPTIPDKLAEALAQGTPAPELSLKGLTPEGKTAYQIAVQHRPESSGHNDEDRLQKALAHGGGALKQFEDRGDFWRVEWETSDGERHTSAISKDDLTVISSGVCLNQTDKIFDLVCLPRVVENRYQRFDVDD